jgi:hypothetical protein
MASNGLLNITIPDLPKILANFRGLPHQMTKLLGLSIKDALSAGRTTLIGRGAASEGIRSRYNVKYRTMMQAIGRPRWNGLNGSLDIAGPRIPLAEFPYKDTGETGVEVQEVKGHNPIVLRHAFAPNNRIYQRDTPTTGRLPIRWVMGLSVAQMAKNAAVMPATEARIKEQLAKRLWHYISQFNAGTLPSRVLKGR